MSLCPAMYIHLQCTHTARALHAHCTCAGSMFRLLGCFGTPDTQLLHIQGNPLSIHFTVATLQLLHVQGTMSLSCHTLTPPHTHSSFTFKAQCPLIIIPLAPPPHSHTHTPDTQFLHGQGTVLPTKATHRAFGYLFGILRKVGCKVVSWQDRGPANCPLPRVKTIATHAHAHALHTLHARTLAPVVVCMCMPVTCVCVVFVSK